MSINLKEKPQLNSSFKKIMDKPYHSQKNIYRCKPRIKQFSFISHISLNREYSDKNLYKKHNENSGSPMNKQSNNIHSIATINKNSHTSKNSKDFSIKTLEKNIKQKILDLSMRIEKEEDIENNSHSKNSFFSKKYFNESVNNSSSIITNKKESSKKLNDSASVNKSSIYKRNSKLTKLSDFSPKFRQDINRSISKKKFLNDSPTSNLNLTLCFDIKKDNQKKLIERIHRKIEIKKRIYDSLDYFLHYLLIV